MSKTSSYPKLLWPLDIQNVQQGGEAYLHLRDPRGLAPEAILVPRAFSLVLSLMDGETSGDEILGKASPYGLSRELLDALIAELDERGFLENAGTQQRWEDIKAEYAALEVRPPAHAGLVYAGEKAALEREISTYLSQADPVSRPEGTLVGMMCPHIDYRRGWQSYAACYRVLESEAKPDLLVLLGTSHQYSEELYHLTTHDFLTPLGRVACANPLVESMAKRYGERRCLANQILHQTEHSLELQLPFLQMLYREHMPQILPILVGSFHEYFAGGREPKEDARVADFIGALAETLGRAQAEGRNILFYAGVDLAHVGRFFGDSVSFDSTALAEVEIRDRQLLETLKDCDPSALYEHMAEDADARRVCGYPSLYTMMATMNELGLSAAGHTIEYRQAVDTSQDCHVSFGSLAWKQ